MAAIQTLYRVKDCRIFIQTIILCTKLLQTSAKGRTTHRRYDVGTDQKEECTALLHLSKIPRKCYCPLTHSVQRAFVPHSSNYLHPPPPEKIPLIQFRKTFLAHWSTTTFLTREANRSSVGNSFLLTIVQGI